MSVFVRRVTEAARKPRQVSAAGNRRPKPRGQHRRESRDDLPQPAEVGDEDGGAFEVEIRLQDGSEVGVHLDENCKVIGQELDDDGADEEDESDDD